MKMTGAKLRTAKHQYNMYVIHYLL